MEKLKKWISNFFNAFKVSGIPFLIGLLGAFAGSEGTSKNWRRIIIPLIFTFCAFLELKSFWVVLLMIQSACLSMGYGIPDYKWYYTGGDEGSTLGKFWYNIFNKNENEHKTFWANVFTRGTIGLGIVSSFLVIPILKNNWLFYFLGSLGIVLVYAFNSWGGYGQFIIKWKNKTYYLLKVDFITYSVLGICGLFIIMKG